MKKRSLFLLLIGALSLVGCEKKGDAPPGGTVSSVSISQPSIEVQLGKRSTDVTVTVDGEGDFNKNVSIVSENEAIAKASFTEVESGKTFKVYGIGEGTTTINLVSAQDETKATSLSVQVKGKPVEPELSEILSVSLSKETHLFHLSDDPLEVTATLNGRGTYDQTIEIEIPNNPSISIDKSEVQSGGTFNISPLAVSNNETITLKAKSKQDPEKYAELVVRVDEDIEPETPEDVLSLNARARTLQEGGESFTITATASSNEIDWSFKEADATQYVDFEETPVGKTATIVPKKATPEDKVATLVARLGETKAECKFRVSEKPTEFRTYYLSNNAFLNYEQVYFYTWNEDGLENAPYPGEKLTTIVKNTLGEDCYEFTVDTLTYTGFKFSDGYGHETIDTPYAFGSSNNVWYDDNGYHFATVEKDVPTVSFYTNSVTLYEGEEASEYGFTVRKGVAQYEVTSGGERINVTSFTNGSISVEGVAVGSATIRVFIPGEPGQEDLAEDFLYVEVKDPATVTSFYFSNNPVVAWEKVYVYGWVGDESMNWPGNQLFSPLKNKEGEDVYLIHLDAKYDHVIINNGEGEQTVDIDLNEITIDAEHNNMYPTGDKTEGKYEVALAKFEEFTYSVAFAESSVTLYGGKNLRVNVVATGEGVTYNVTEGSENVQLYKTGDNHIILKWLQAGEATIVATLHGVTASLSVTCSNEPAPETSNNLYFTNNKGWSDVYLYTWGEGHSDGWPGTKLADPVKNKFNEDVYVFEIDEGLYDSFLVHNNNGEQSVDISLDDEHFATNNNVYLQDGKDDTGHYLVGFAPFEPLAYSVEFEEDSVTVYEGSNTRVEVTATAPGVEYAVTSGSDVVEIVSSNDNHVTLKWLKAGSATITASLAGESDTLAVTCSSEAPPYVIKSIYFTNNKNWSNLHLYAWSDANPTAWPGEELSDPIKNSNLEDVYVLEINATKYEHFIVNGSDSSGSQQTINIDVNDAKFATFDNIYVENTTDELGHHNIGYANFTPHEHSYDPVTHQCECGAYDPDASIDFVTVRFVVNYKTSLGQNIYIYGIGGWDDAHRIAMNYDMEKQNGDWYVDVELQVGVQIGFKFVMVEGTNKSWEKEGDGNERHYTPSVSTTESLTWGNY